MRRSAGLSMVIACAVFVVACSPSQSAFKHGAEKTIDADDGKKLTVDVKDATCEEPASTKAETTFPCQAIDEQGMTYNFTARITGSNKFEVVQN